MAKNSKVIRREFSFTLKDKNIGELNMMISEIRKELLARQKAHEKKMNARK